MTPALIGMTSSYSGLDQADWLWKQTPAAFGHWNAIQMAAPAPQPDFLLLYQFDFHRVLNPSQRPWYKRWLAGDLAPPLPPDPQAILQPYLRQLPRERILFLLREPPLPEVRQANRQNYSYAQHYCSYISGPDGDAPQPGYMPAIWYVNQSFQELNEAAPPEKQRPCSWITSGISRTASHRQRLDFLRQVQESDLPIEVYGRGLPDWTRSAGSLHNKGSGMTPYYYNLAIENFADNEWYVSEKLWDALLCWCLPIYYGGSAADALLPPGSFLRLPSLDQRGLDYIREVIASPEAWHEARAAIAEARQLILHKLNLLNWLSDYVKGCT